VYVCALFSWWTHISYSSHTCMYVFSLIDMCFRYMCFSVAFGSIRFICVSVCRYAIFDMWSASIQFLQIPPIWISLHFLFVCLSVSIFCVSFFFVSFLCLLAPLRLLFRLYVPVWVHKYSLMYGLTVPNSDSVLCTVIWCTCFRPFVPSSTTLCQ